MTITLTSNTTATAAFTPLTIKEWQCYLDTPQSIVDAVNILIELHLKEENTPEDALHSIFPMLNAFSSFGFRDTECEIVAVEIINNYYTDCFSVHRFDYYTC
jgi:hypothetical protein